MSKSKPTMLFYVSGHGFGHSTRVIEVARQLPDSIRVIFKTSAPRWLYECYYNRPLEFYPQELDVGVVQLDSLALDEKKTLETYARMLDRFPSLIESERRFVQSEGVDLIVGDIPPVAFDIANAAGIPSAGLANFSWDWIYRPYVEYHLEYAWVIDKIRESYAKCNLLLRLPFHGDFSAFPNIKDVPLVVRSPAVDQPDCSNEHQRESLICRIGLRPDKQTILLSFGGFDLERIPWDKIEKMEKYQFLYFRYPVKAANVIHVSNGVFPHVDMVQLSDVVLSKPGYGICAETIKTQTPLVYTDRGEFLEYDCLVEGLKRYARSLYIPQKDLLEGRWEPYLEQALHLPEAENPLQSDGALVAAKYLLSLLDTGPGTKNGE